MGRNLPRTGRAALLAVATLLAACAGEGAGVPTAPAPVPAVPSLAPPTVADLLALDDVRRPADSRYLALLAQAQRDGPAITRERMIALRWAWMGSTDFNPIMATRLAQRARPRAGDDCARARQAAAAVLEIYWLDLRSHDVMAACARRDGDAPAAAVHGAARDAIVAAMRASGDGSAAERAMTVISVDEEYALLEIIGARRTGVTLAERRGRKLDVMEVAGRQDDRRFTLWFDVSGLFEFYEHRRTRPPLHRT